MNPRQQGDLGEYSAIEWLLDGRRWFIPSSVVEGTTAILLGGPKYEEFEVEAGRPFVTLAAARRGSEAVKRTAL